MPLASREPTPVQSRVKRFQLEVQELDGTGTIQHGLEGTGPQPLHGHIAGRVEVKLAQVLDGNGDIHGLGGHDHHLMIMKGVNLQHVVHDTCLDGGDHIIFRLDRETFRSALLDHNMGRVGNVDGRNIFHVAALRDHVAGAPGRWTAEENAAVKYTVGHVIPAELGSEYDRAEEAADHQETHQGAGVAPIWTE